MSHYSECNKKTQETKKAFRPMDPVALSVKTDPV